MRPQKQNMHAPVMLQEVLAALKPLEGDSYLDLTAGYGGHAAAVLALTHAPAQAVLVDRDDHAITSLKQVFTPPITLHHQNFAEACQTFVTAGKRFSMILADLGVSSPHLDNASRGFSFMTDGPLDMRMDQSAELSAETIVNEWPEGKLADVIWQYGEEPQSRRIAHAIVEHRPLHTTLQLADVIATALGGRHGRIHPATKTFQAIRIAVNDELRQLQMALPLMVQLLAPGGRLAIISFHSLEDRLVKQFFSEQAGERYDAPLRLVTKNPVTASMEEIVLNPRARSAKLRSVAKK